RWYMDYQRYALAVYNTVEGVTPFYLEFTATPEGQKYLKKFDEADNLHGDRVAQAGVRFENRVFALLERHTRILTQKLTIADKKTLMARVLNLSLESPVKNSNLHGYEDNNSLITPELEFVMDSL